MTSHDIANLTEVIFFGTIIFLVMALLVTFLSGLLYLMLKKMFGKSTASTETEPGQLPRKAKKAAAAPAVEAFAAERIEPTFSDDSALVAHTTSRLSADIEEVDEAPDAAAVDRDAAFADRMADQFAAEPVSA